MRYLLFLLIFLLLTKLKSLDISTVPFCERPLNFDGPDFIRVYEFEELHQLKLEEPNLQMFVRNMNDLTELNLDNVDLSAQGSNRSKTLANALPRLQSLSLSFCRLSGSIHPSFSQLQSLSHIDLEGNDLSSEAPHFFANFSNLVTLSLRSCDLQGNFPENVLILPKLQSIDLSDNSLLTGHLPKFPFNSSLRQLKLYNTNFRGKLPDSIGNLMFLTHLLLSSSNFIGSIPSLLANLTLIVELDLRGNSFSGSIPPFHASAVPNLEFLRLSSNLLNGVIYSSLFTLPSLQGLCLDNNHFSGQLEEFSNASSSDGPIPKSISKLPRLVYLELAANNFYGTMKLDIFQSLRNLNSLDLSDNKLSIEGDNGSFTLPNLAALKLSRCNLTEVPKFLKNQVGLKTLNLSNNQIHGSVPSWIWNSGSLYELDLSQNAVDFLEQPLLADSNQSKTVIDGGKNPSSSILGVLALRSCNLSRFPDFLKNQDILFYIDLSDNKINGRTPSWIWKKNLRI
ncbi:unnamed protein product [Ilex paraguariensis]|uniref:Uncharacterized protein n=1 Tax=Ilex paraguariensis TaxID=185542 RepID=A0ABC8UHD9_9AQUA